MDEKDVKIEVRLTLLEERQKNIENQLTKIDNKLDAIIQEPLADMKHYKRLLIGQVISWVGMIFLLGLVVYLNQ